MGYRAGMKEKHHIQRQNEAVSYKCQEDGLQVLRKTHHLTGAGQAKSMRPDSRAEAWRFTRLIWGMANGISGEGSRPLKGSGTSKNLGEGQKEGPHGWGCKLE